ncbi:MAG: ABC transporter substrate-binding protein, partial [Gammaproteobacteria bacterium]|nr:ABC transporter substrate-binding protein [Gammaproteobacteria bacterium]
MSAAPRRNPVRLLPLLVACMLAAGCTDPAPRLPAGGGPAKVFRYSLADTPGSLDPVRASTVYQSQLILNLFDTLYEYKFLQRPYVLKPALASALPVVSEDGLTYTISLRTGQRFADDAAFPGGKGREIVAADVVYSLQRQFDPANKPAGTWLWQDRIVGLDEWKQAGADYAVPVAGLRALDTHVLQIQLKRPYPQLIYTLAMASAAIVPREAVEFYGREFSINPVGSGPFRLASFDSARAVLIPNPNYRREPLDLQAEGYDPASQGGYGLERLDGRAPPFLDRLEISFVRESSARWSSFTKTDELQFTGLPNEQLYRVLESTEPVQLKPEFARAYHMQSALEAGLVFNVFNMSFPELGYHPDPLRNKRNHALRCAIIKGFDWEARNESFYGGLGVIFPGIIPPAVAEFD